MFHLSLFFSCHSPAEPNAALHGGKTQEDNSAAAAAACARESGSFTEILKRRVLLSRHAPTRLRTHARMRRADDGSDFPFSFPV